jgi:hypothetical protein
MKKSIVEHTATFLDALKGLEAAEKYMCQFDTMNCIIVMHSRVENELCRL